VSFELIILGSSSALPTSKRSTSAHLLSIGERFFLIDCGEGTQSQLRKFRLSPARINHIFISHLHGDHVFGLFGLISSMGMMGRNATLHLYGPGAMEEMMRAHFNFFGDPTFPVQYHKAGDKQIVYEDSKVEVMALLLKHRTETFGYVFKEKSRLLNINKARIEEYGLGLADIKKVKEGEDFTTSAGKLIPNAILTLPPFRTRSYAYISDSAAKPEIIPYIKDVDLLYHEATFLSQDAELAAKTMHSTAAQAAHMAALAKAGKLLIGHFSTRYKNETSFLNEATEIFEPTIAVNDGDRFTVEQQRISADEL